LLAITTLSLGASLLIILVAAGGGVHLSFRGNKYDGQGKDVFGQIVVVESQIDVCMLVNKPVTTNKDG
jgi:hypothetical protein